MILPKVCSQCILVEIILRLTLLSITDMAPLMFLSAVNEKLVFTIKVLLAKATLRMSLEPALIYSSRIVISHLQMFAQLLIRK